MSEQKRGVGQEEQEKEEGQEVERMPSSFVRSGGTAQCAAISTPHKRGGHVAGGGARGRSRRAEVGPEKEVELAREEGQQKEVGRGLWRREAHEWRV